MRKVVIRILTVTAAGAALAVAVVPALRRRARRMGEAAEKRLRYEQGRMEGMRYRAEGRTPEPNVDDDILADRVRSSIGPVEKRLDIPRVHVSVVNHVVHLHGVVGTPEERLEIERACEMVSGVRGIESYLHIGLGPGDTRPSEALWHPEPSRQLRQLLDAARTAGAAPTGTWLAVRAVLSTFSDRIPEGELRHVFAHLPADVVGLASAPRRIGAAPTRTVPQLIETVRAITGLSDEVAADVTESVVGTLRTLVPDEASDVAATLPTELRELWNSAVPA